MKNLAMIACISRDCGLGNAGELLWHIPADMKFFRETTMGHPVIMGGKTYRSIGKPLPGRENVVLSRSEPEGGGAVWIKSLDELHDYIQKDNQLKFIIGGASLYEHFLPEADILYLTDVDAVKPADVYFPNFDLFTYDITDLTSGEADGVRYVIRKYQRR